MQPEGEFGDCVGLRDRCSDEALNPLIKFKYCRLQSRDGAPVCARSCQGSGASRGSVYASWGVRDAQLAVGIRYWLRRNFCLNAPIVLDVFPSALAICPAEVRGLPRSVAGLRGWLGAR